MSSNSLPWLARSGGHGYSPTLHSIQNAVLINLENFNYVKVEDDGTVVVGTGAKFGDLIDTVGTAGREFSKSFQPRYIALILTFTQPWVHAPAWSVTTPFLFYSPRWSWELRDMF